MNFNRFVIQKLIIIIFIIFLTSSVFAEMNLEFIGFSDFEVKGVSTEECKTFNLVIPEQFLENEKTPIFDFNISFSQNSDKAILKFNLNDSVEKEIWPKEMNCTNNCYLKTYFPANLMRLENNFEVCIKNVGATNSTKIFSNSKLGFYNSPAFEIKHVSPEAIVVGERAGMIIEVENNGNIDANANVSFISDFVRLNTTITKFDIVEGQSSVTKTFLPSKKEQFFYYVKPSEAGSYILPSATLEFIDVFGKKQKVYSDYPQLFVSDTNDVEITLIPVGLNDKDVFEFKAKLKNFGNNTIKVLIKINPTKEVVGSIKEIALEENEEKEVTFETSKLEIGQHVFVATIFVGDKEINSNEISTTVKSKGFSQEFFYSIAGIIISITLFIGIMLFWKEKKN